MALYPLTIILKIIPLHLRLKRPKSNFTSVAQDPALSVTDLYSVDLQQPCVRGPHSVVQNPTYECAIR